MAGQKVPSERQRNILSFIWRYTNQCNRSPSYREIVKSVGVSSPGVVDYHVKQLETMGLLSHEKGIARSLSLTDKALALLSRSSDTIRAAITSVQLPIRGDIAAGEPVNLGNDSFLTYDEDDVIVADASRLPAHKDRLYALRVRGHSMIDALVDDGDVVILQKVIESDEVRNGDMVAAWLPLREELTLKRIYREGKMTRLQPANPDFEPIVAPSPEVEVHGKVVLVQRHV